ncbi:MAG: tail fiber domain-containing protein [Bacteroidetes bacterium]|nr:tail fiber domain-containing protein [Bacteroidota bacterium]
MKLQITLFCFCILGGSVSVALAQKMQPSSIPVSPKNSPMKSARTLDVVVNDDHIVIGSSCVGLDCINGENFGFHTIRLKENNTRIGFDDTSNSLNFASNDWELEANESPAGGTNSFAIRDATANRSIFKMMAGAPEASLFIQNNGKVGLGTSNPQLELHINDDDSPSLRLEQNGSGGWGTQTWDVAANEANFFIRDVTNASKLPFRIRPGAPTSSIDIDANGNVRIGTATAVTTKLHVEGNAYIKDTLYVQNHVSLGVNSPSDRKLKTDIQEFTNATSLLANLQPKTYQYDRTKYPEMNFPNSVQYGLIAQEVEELLPALVSEVHHPKGIDFKSVNYVGLIPILVQGIKEMQEKINDQQRELAQLREQLLKVDKLNDRLSQLEAALGSMKGAGTNPSRSGR